MLPASPPRNDFAKKLPNRTAPFARRAREA